MPSNNILVQLTNLFYSFRQFVKFFFSIQVSKIHFLTSVRIPNRPKNYFSFNTRRILSCKLYPVGTNQVSNWLVCVKKVLNKFTLTFYKQMSFTIFTLSKIRGLFSFSSSFSRLFILRLNKIVVFITQSTISFTYG